MTSVYAKYWILAGIDILISVLTYLNGQPQITEGTLITGALIALPLVAHDLENEPTAPK